MWTPPERIRYRSSIGPVPTREEAQRARLFSPVRVGPLTLENRVWVPAMVPWRASEDGVVTPELVEWYGRFARGRPGAIVVEATGIRDIPSGPLLRIGHDRFLPGLEQIVSTVHRQSGGHTRLFIQIIDFLAIRRRPEPDKYFERFLKITDRHRHLLQAPDWPETRVREHLTRLPHAELAEVLTPRELEALDYGLRERVTDMDLPHIRDLPKVLPGLFAAAALRAKRAGFDGAELHYAHAYTMASFLSATNDRSDGYGGTREARVRLPLEVYRAAREAVGADYLLGCRFLAEECIEGGSTVDDAAYFAVELARAGMDFLSTSRGGKFDDAKQPGIGWAAYPYTGRSGYECMPGHISDPFGPWGRNRSATAIIRKAVRAAGMTTPITCVGGVHRFDQAEEMLARGECDLVGLARQSLADPDWALKLSLGLGEQVRVCEYTNYCEGLDQKHKQVTCQLWDREALDAPGVHLSRDGRRRLVAPDWEPPA